ncbi:MAG: OBAP family protein [Gemmatimonadaceae bacterium]|nr:OBAP family protein [Gemmatimonadaceae bacterium]
MPLHRVALRGRRCAASFAVVSLAAACGGNNTPPEGDKTAPGENRSVKTAVLENGAALMQDKTPIKQIALYLDGFHAAKDDPTMQMEAHHYCNQVDQDCAQCVLYDGNTEAARLMGVEYIISAKLYATLPPGERQYWHPHNYEILSGELRAPGLPDAAENPALKGKINSYGKTWHTWMTGMHGRTADALPLGPPHLQWSFNRDGEANPEMVAARDQRMKLNTADARKDRTSMAADAQPQGGVDAMKGKFPHATTAPAGVSDNGDKSTYGVPVVVAKP